MRSVRRVLRPMLALAALAWMLGIVGDWSHSAMVQHVVCPEHGELLDAGDAPAKGAVNAVLPAAAQAHDACALDGAMPVVLTAFSPLVLGDVPFLLTTARPPAPRLVADDVIALAPKTSPPTA